jgi:tRNA(adenine34) deaminase
MDNLMFESHKFMLAALQASHRSHDFDEVPVGAVVVYKHKIISASHNLTRTMNDPTAHAEIVAIREASSYLKQYNLSECDIYVTLEPCPMCAHAISLARFKRLFFGAYDPKGGGVEHGPKIYNLSSCNHKIEYYGGILEDECAAMLKQFFQNKR